MFLSRRINLPLYFVLLLLLALGLNLARGFDLSRRHNLQLQPRRPVAVLDLRTQPAAAITIDAAQGHLLVHLPDQSEGSLALRQILPSRTLLRWSELADGKENWLVVPLAGLGRGEYGLCWTRPKEQEPLPLEDEHTVHWNWLGRFTLE